MLQRYLLLWLVASSGVAFYWPRLADLLGLPGDPLLVAAPDGREVPRIPLGWVVACTMFAIGSLLPRDEVSRVVKRWPVIVGGTSVQYLTMPLLAFGLASLFQLPRELFIGVVLVGCVPGAMASNVLTLAARGNVSYSIGLTTSATLFSPLVVPVALLLCLSTTADIDALAISYQLVCQVVGPVVLGYVLAGTWPAFGRFMAVVGNSMANLAILWIIASVVALNRDRLGNTPPTVLTVLFCLNLAGYMAGHLGARLLNLDEGMRRALTLEVGMQNAGVGTALAVSLFPDYPEATIPTAAYTFGCMLTGTVLAWRFSRIEAAIGSEESLAAAESRRLPSVGTGSE